MVKLILDANILIGLRQVGILDKFLTFLDDEKEHEIIMSKENLMECGGVLMSRMRKCTYFNGVDTISKIRIKNLKKECRRLINKELHSKKDRDYHVIACAMEKGTPADFVVTNDRDIIRFFDKFKSSVNQLKKTKSLTLAGFFHFMYGLRKDIFSHKIFTKSNLDAYEIIEIENYFNIMEHHEKFKSNHEKDVWKNHALNIYKPYSENVMKVFS